MIGGRSVATARALRDPREGRNAIKVLGVMIPAIFGQTWSVVRRHPARIVAHWRFHRRRHRLLR